MRNIFALIALKSVIRDIRNYIFSLIWCGNSLCDGRGAQRDKVLVTELFEEGVTCFAALVKKGRMYTDKLANVSVLSGKSVVSCVSWEYDGSWAIDDPLRNRSLHPGKKLFNSWPVKINDNVISIVSGGGGNYNLYHWMYDCLPRIKIARESFALDSPIYYVPSLKFPFQIQSLEMMGILENCVSSQDIQHFISDNLVATSHPNPDHSNIPFWIVEYLRETFGPRAALRAKDLGLGQFVYISRGDATNGRRVVNEAAIVSTLNNLADFHVCHLAEMDFLDQMAVFSAAKIIVGGHGAGFAHLCFSPRGAHVVELFSDVYELDCFESISSVADLCYHSIGGNSIGPRVAKNCQDFIVEPDSIKRKIEDILA